LQRLPNQRHSIRQPVAPTSVRTDDVCGKAEPAAGTSHPTKSRKQSAGRRCIRPRGPNAESAEATPVPPLPAHLGELTLRSTTHHHISRTFYFEEWREEGRRNSQAASRRPPWSPEARKSSSWKPRRDAAITAISTPGFTWSDNKAEARRRFCNELPGTDGEHPARLAASRSSASGRRRRARELEDSLDVLKLDGVCCEATHAAESRRFPVSEAVRGVQKRAAVVFVDTHALPRRSARNGPHRKLSTPVTRPHGRSAPLKRHISRGTRPTVRYIFAPAGRTRSRNPAALRDRRRDGEPGRRSGTREQSFQRILTSTRHSPGQTRSSTPSARSAGAGRVLFGSALPLHPPPDLPKVPANKSAITTAVPTIGERVDHRRQTRPSCSHALNRRTS